MGALASTSRIAAANVARERPAPKAGPVSSAPVQRTWPPVRLLGLAACAVGGALAASAALPWVVLAVRAQDALAGTPAAQIARTGYEGPVASGGRLVAAFGALGALLMLPFVLDRPLLLGQRRAGLHAMFAFGLATWFAVHGLRTAGYDVWVPDGGATIPARAEKIGTGVGLRAALVLAPLGVLLAGGAWLLRLSRSRPGGP
jgi:hypothetical protein